MQLRQLNYVSSNLLYFCSNNKCKKMELYARAADCISIGDQVDKVIRSTSAWSLLPTQVRISRSYLFEDHMRNIIRTVVSLVAALYIGSNPG